MSVPNYNFEGSGQRRPIMTMAEIVQAEGIAETLEAELEREFQPNRKDTSMADTFSAAKQAQNYDPHIYDKARGGSVGIVKETPFTRLSGAVERLRKAHDIVGSVCTNLVGDMPPQNPATAKRLPNGSGLLGGVEELSDSVSDLADEIIEYAERIARRL